MKKLSVIILASILAFVTLNCSKDDGENEKNAVLTGGIWQLTSFTIDGGEKPLSTCARLETFQFMDDGTFSQKIYSSNSAEDGCELETERTGKWVKASKEDFFNITFDNDTFQDIIFNIGVRTLGYGISVTSTDDPTKFYGYYFEKK